MNSQKPSEQSRNCWLPVKGIGASVSSVYFYNPSNSVRSLENCWVYEVAVHASVLNEGSYSSAKLNEVAVNDNLIVGVTTENEFKQNYKEYSKEASGEYKYGTYREDVYVEEELIDGEYRYNLFW